MGGTYTLVIALESPATLEIGALGEREFREGEYAYTGSAFGPGGFSRVERHRELARGEREVRHWHIDYLLGHSTTAIEAVVRTPGEDVECAVARSLPDAGIAGFGASDCDCTSHLAYAADGLLEAVERGGSHAQRDVLDLTLLEAALRSGQHDLAKALTAERLAAKPASPLAALFARRAQYGQ